ncbi:hypothetical protein C8R44DRAFT_794465 [Mycena epipterygia]|nr:hypothetical protein C8R44DRAFT_794465 [Mycena epipterygia]
MSTATPAPLAPFDAGDVILRSSDGVDFRVHRVVLSLTSPVFKDMFTVPQPDSEPDVPIITMAESEALLDLMLRFWYPGTEPTVNSLQELHDVLAVLISKFDIQSAAATGKRFLRDYLPTEPVAVFAIASAHGWADVAKAAARQSLKLPLRVLDYDAPLALNYITAGAYHNLLKFHYRCGVAAKDTTESLRWVVADHYTWFTCTHCAAHKAHWYFDGSLGLVRLWFIDYLAAMGTRLAVAPAADLSAPGAMHGAFKETAKCEVCREKVFDELLDFVTNKWVPRLQEVLDQIELTV